MFSARAYNIVLNDHAFFWCVITGFVLACISPINWFGSPSLRCLPRLVSCPQKIREEMISCRHRSIQEPWLGKGGDETMLVVLPIPYD